MEFDFSSFMNQTIVSANQYRETNPQEFWIAVAVIVFLLYLLFKRKRHGHYPRGFSPFEWEVFKRRRY